MRLGKTNCAANMGRLVCCFAALLILRRDSQTALPKFALSVGSSLSVNGLTVGLLGLLITFCGFAKKRIATCNLSFKNAAGSLDDVHVNENTAFLQRSC